jgi:hypothetical protein
MGLHQVVVETLYTGVSHGHWVVLNFWLLDQVRAHVASLRVEVPGNDYRLLENLSLTVEGTDDPGGEEEDLEFHPTGESAHTEISHMSVTSWQALVIPVPLDLFDGFRVLSVRDAHEGVVEFLVLLLPVPLFEGDFINILPGSPHWLRDIMDPPGLLVEFFEVLFVLVLVGSLRHL